MLPSDVNLFPSRGESDEGVIRKASAVRPAGENRPILGMIQHGGKSVIKMLPDVKQRTIEPGAPLRHCTRFKTKSWLSAKVWLKFRRNGADSW